MDMKILQALFLDNPGLPEQVAAFCQTLPDCVQAEADYRRAMDELEKLIGRSRCLELEERFSWHLAREVRAYYLFGLGLRREILRELAG